MGRAILVAGLGFGDEGKGTIVDYLTRQERAHTVVRYNGGAQAAHNVVTDDGRHHTFAQFGSGTFAGAETYLSEFMLVNPISLLSEAKHLESVGVANPLWLMKIHRNALVTTPFHIAANRLQEMARANGRHGSCGMGIGETIRVALRHGIGLRANHCKSDNLKIAWVLLDTIRKLLLIETEEVRRSLPETEQVMRERRVLEDPNLDYILDFYERLGPLIVDDDYESRLLDQVGTIIFEGAQGVLLDQDFGFHPHTTWSDTTFTNAMTMIKRTVWGPRVEKLGVLRAHMTRHGAGPFPTEDVGLSVPTDHNCFGEWQQNFRVGWLDFVLARYALLAIGGVDSIALTHLDLAETFNKACFSYNEPDGPHILFSNRLALPKGASDTPKRLCNQESLGQMVAKTAPVYQEMAGPEAFMKAILDELGVKVSITSYGPKPQDKRRL